MPTALRIPVDDDLLTSWREWFAPANQPFSTANLSEDMRATLPAWEPGRLTPEVRDTFMVYLPGWTMLDRDEFLALAPQARRALVAARPPELRRVWWPEDLASAGDLPVVRYVEHGVVASDHQRVDGANWQGCRRILPGAGDLAGSFAHGSGANCFGTVMAAAGVAGAESQWMFQEPFEEWLDASTVRIRGTAHDDEPGTVLVWRDAEGVAQHTAVTIGDGWCLSKPSQAWCSPRLVWTTRKTISRYSFAGTRMERYRIHR